MGGSSGAQNTPTGSSNDFHTRQTDFREINFLIFLRISHQFGISRNLVKAEAMAASGPSGAKFHEGPPGPIGPFKGTNRENLGKYIISMTIRILHYMAVGRL